MKTTALLLCFIAHKIVAATVSWDTSPDATILGYRIHFGDGDEGIYQTMVDVGQGTPVTQALWLCGVPLWHDVAIVGYYWSRTSAWAPSPPQGVARRYMVTAYADASIESLPSNEVTIPELVRLSIVTEPREWTLQESADLMTWTPSATDWKSEAVQPSLGIFGPVNQLRVSFQVFAHMERMFFRLKAE